MKTLLVLLVVCLSGCAGSQKIVIWNSQPIHTPDGHWGSAIFCRNDADCWMAAGRACPGGYNVLSLRTTNGWSVNVDRFSADASSHHHETMIVECR